jgi:hypothetical protein
MVTDLAHELSSIPRIAILQMFFIGVVLRNYNENHAAGIVYTNSFKPNKLTVSPERFSD